MGFYYETLAAAEEDFGAGLSKNLRHRKEKEVVNVDGIKHRFVTGDIVMRQETGRLTKCHVGWFEICGDNN